MRSRKVLRAEFKVGGIELCGARGKLGQSWVTKGIQTGRTGGTVLPGEGGCAGRASRNLKIVRTNRNTQSEEEDYSP